MEAAPSRGRGWKHPHLLLVAELRELARLLWLTCLNCGQHSAALRFCFSSESCFGLLGEIDVWSCEFTAWSPTFFSSGVGGSDIVALSGSLQCPRSFWPYGACQHTRGGWLGGSN